MNRKYEKLFSPFTFPNQVTIKNRIIMSPMTTFSGFENGKYTLDELNYYQARIEGVGMVIAGCAYVNRNGKAFIGQPAIDDDKYIPNLKKLADLIHEKHGVAIMQLHHGGRECHRETLLLPEPLSASAVISLREWAITPRAMTSEEILDTIEDFGAATLRAIKAGYDGVEIHGANTYLLQQFFSPHANQRKDEWGGTLKKRMKFPLAVVEKVLAVVKEHSTKPFIVGYRISPEEIENPGITLEDTCALMDHLVKYPLDYIHISNSWVWRKSLRNKENPTPVINEIINRFHDKIPLIAVGGVKTPDDALKVLDSNIPLVAMGRELIAEPQWVHKVESGNELAIRTSIKLSDLAELQIPQPLLDLFIEDNKNWKMSIED